MRASVHQFSVLLVTVGSLVISRAEASSQGTGVITGQVIEVTTQRPLASAQVSIPGTGQGGLTNAQGRFLLTNVGVGEQTVRVEFLGYGTVTEVVSVTADGTTTVNFSLRQEALGLDALVVTGTPGAAQARSLGNTVGRIRAAERQEAAPTQNLTQMLNGATPGLNVATGGGGKISGGANIRIRGAASASLSAQPLVYVDGIRVDGNAADLAPGVSSRTPPSRLNDINPEDIQSIEVIKGPAAATLYGTEASNGVINIITKRGSAGEPEITLRVGQGGNWYPNPEEMFPSTYFRCRGTSGECTPGEVVEFNVLREDRIRNGNEWFRTGRAQNYGANIAGGGQGFRFYTSLDFDRDEGVTFDEWRNRLSGRANLNWTPSEKVDVQIGLAQVRSRMRDGSANSDIALPILWSCPAPGCEEGSGLSNAVDGAFRGYIGYLPEVSRDSVFGFEDVQRNNVSVQLTHRPSDWLTHRLVTGADWSEVRNSLLFMAIRGVGHLNDTRGFRQETARTTQFISVDYGATASFDATEEVRLSTSGGVQFHQRDVESVGSVGRAFAVPSLTNVGSGTLQSVNDAFLQNKSLGVYVQQEVAWRDRLFFTAAARGDDNSAFGADFDFVLYPKLSASWVLSDEEFFQDNAWFSELRLRGAWGQAGQQPDVFAAVRTFAPATGPGGVGTVTTGNIGNPGLKPEVGTEIEAGFDVSLLQDRVGFEFSYYSQVREDAIIQVPSRPSLGFPGMQFRNLGEIANQGFEFGLNVDVYQRQNAGVNVALAFSTNSNKITEMGGVPPQILQGVNPTTGWAQQMFVEGFPLGAFWQKRVVSADIEGTGAAARGVNVMCEGGTVLPVSSAGFPLARGNGTVVPCDEAPHLYRGQPIPTRDAAVTTTVRLGALQLNAQADYHGGNHMVDGNVAGAHMFFRDTKAILDRTDPILLGYEAIGRDGVNQPGLIDASYMRLSSVSATYEVPADWAARVRANRLSVNLTAQNLWTIWQATDEMFGLKILDPASRITRGTSTDPGGLSGYQQSVMPTMKRFLLSLRVHL